MGWFFVNILLPTTLPLMFLTLVKLVDLPQPYVARAQLIRVVQDGQLGWVAMGFSASATYDLLTAVMDGNTRAPNWAGIVIVVALVFLAMSGLLAMLGTLFPVNKSKSNLSTWALWMGRYRLFVGTLLATIISALLYSFVHYNLPAH